MALLPLCRSHKIIFYWENFAEVSRPHTNQWLFPALKEKDPKIVKNLPSQRSVQELRIMLLDDFPIE